MALERLSLRGVANFDASLVSRVVKHAEGDYIKVADVQYNPSHDATVSVDITDGAMKAVVMIGEPGLGGADVSADYVRSYLQSNGVVHGIKEGVLAELEDAPRYGRPIVVAEGTKAHDGENAHIVYNFKVERENVTLKEKDGRVDFKDISHVENVVAGQVLARKVPAELGQPGQTVTGTTIPATRGKDCELVVGKNVKLSEDGLQALSEINGQVLLLGRQDQRGARLHHPRGREPPHGQYPLPGNRHRQRQRGGRLLREGRREHRGLRKRRQVPDRRGGRHHCAPGDRREDGGQGPLRQEPVFEVHRARARGRRANTWW